MSPRAAWRLEAFGYVEVYDYVAGKADWRAAGLASDVMAGMGPSGGRLCVVVNDHGVVQGRLRLDRVEPADAGPVEEVMELGPATVRADADVAEITERMRRRNVASMIVSDPDGVLLGVVTVESTKEPSP